ncbi:hypothetical protein BCR35DRAFT_354383 [Leucosporidium creatinivorum]|uniref:FAS1 domain-containing protein n=1 Tax=Leucosporidium creatinivorum TaxID=106004 RepID=A0A1Y2ELF3_9BASI|nr:hypothetical protein BCR35DRAFT_354383 [Leucosporidium creatinivorum]
MLSARLFLASIASFCTLAAATGQQQPLMAQDGPSPFTASKPDLAALLTRSSKTSMFYDYARDSSTVSKLLAAPWIGSGAKSTVLCPLNSAILALSRKPHQGPPTVDDAGTIISNKMLGGSEEEEKERAAYLEKWVQLHIVTDVVDLDGEVWEGKEWQTLVDERKVSFAVSGENGEGRKVLPGDLEIVGVEEASNGLLLLIAGTLSLEQE